jgi:hypothetical protein
VLPQWLHPPKKIRNVRLLGITKKRKKVSAKTEQHKNLKYQIQHGAQKSERLELNKYWTRTIPPRVENDHIGCKRQIQTKRTCSMLFFFLYSNLSGIELTAYEEEGMCALFKNENSIVRIENSLREGEKNNTHRCEATKASPQIQNGFGTCQRTNLRTLKLIYSKVNQ